MAATVNYELFWDEAWQRYLKDTGRSLGDIQKLRTLQSIADLQQHLDSQASEFESFRKKHGRFYKILAKSIHPLIVTTNIVQSGIQNTPVSPVCALLTATAFLVGSANGVSQVYDEIEQLFEKLGSFTIRLEEYFKAEVEDSLRANLVSILCCVLDIIAYSEKAIKDGRFRKYLGIAFVGKDEAIKKAFSRLERLCDEESRLVTAISYTSGQRVDSKMDRLSQSTQKLVDGTAEMTDHLKTLATHSAGTHRVASDSVLREQNC
jgi:fungal STAND N-terminal Goodbye domain